jgi:hypothetical protein
MEDYTVVEKISIWKNDKGFCVKAEAEDVVYIYGTKRSAFKALEAEFDKLYQSRVEVA